MRDASRASAPGRVPSTGWSAAGSTRTDSVGDADPLQAIADTLPIFAADEIVIAGDTSLAERLASRARARFGLPVLRGDEMLARAA